MEVVKTTKRTAREAIGYYVKNAPENSRIFTIEPGDADWMLATYQFGGQRAFRSHKIKIFAEHMKTGKWGLTGDTLKFSNTGALIDGQNRLKACVRSGASFRSHIVFGVDETLFKVMDRGGVRNAPDILKIDGFTNTAALAAACRWVKLLESGKAKQRDTYEPEKILEMLKQDYKRLPDFVPTARAIWSNVKAPPGLTAAILFLGDRIDSRKAAEFGRIWELGGQDRHGRPIKGMLEELTRLGAASHGRVHDTVRAALAIVAWNLFMQGRAGTKASFRWDLADDFPVMAS